MLEQDAARARVAELKPGRTLAGDYLVLDVVKAQSSRGSDYLSLNLADRTGKVGAKVWDLDEALEQVLQNGRVVKIQGQVETYRGQAQVVIKWAESRPQEDLDWREFLPASARPAKEMRAELEALVATLADDDYRWLLETVLNHPRVTDDFNTAPAAKAFHHAYLNGLLEHTLSVARLADRIAAHYPQLNRDLLIAGAVLHDLGKVWEFSPPPQIEMTTSGRLLGHLIMGASFLRGIIDQAPGFPEGKAMLLEHLIISHHGEYDFGSPKKPKILEGLALHLADDLDAKINGLGAFIQRHAQPGTGWTDYNRLMEQYFFDPAKGLAGLEPVAASAGRGSRPFRRKTARLAAAAETAADESPAPDDQNLLF